MGHLTFMCARDVPCRQQFSFVRRFSWYTRPSVSSGYASISHLPWSGDSTSSVSAPQQILLSFALKAKQVRSPSNAATA
jgi:hypothetical protein